MFHSSRRSKFKGGKKADTPESIVDRFLKQKRDEEAGKLRTATESSQAVAETPQAWADTTQPGETPNSLRGSGLRQSAPPHLAAGIHPEGSPEFVIMYDNGNLPPSRFSSGTPPISGQRNRFQTPPAVSMGAAEEATPTNAGTPSSQTTPGGARLRRQWSARWTGPRPGTVETETPATGNSANSRRLGSARPSAVRAQTASGGRARGQSAGPARPRSVGKIIRPESRLTILPQLHLPPDGILRPVSAGATMHTGRSRDLHYARGTKSRASANSSRELATARHASPSPSPDAAAGPPTPKPFPLSPGPSESRPGSRAGTSPRREPPLLRSGSLAPGSRPGSPSLRSKSKRSRVRSRNKSARLLDSALNDEDISLSNDFWLGGFPYGAPAEEEWDALDGVEGSPTSSMMGSPRSSEGPRTPGEMSVASSVAEARMGELWDFEHINDLAVDPLRNYTLRDLQLSLRIQSPRDDEEAEELKMRLKERIVARSLQVQEMRSIKSHLIDKTIDVSPEGTRERRRKKLEADRLAREEEEGYGEEGEAVAEGEGEALEGLGGGEETPSIRIGMTSSSSSSNSDSEGGGSGGRGGDELGSDGEEETPATATSQGDDPWMEGVSTLQPEGSAVPSLRHKHIPTAVIDHAPPVDSARAGAMTLRERAAVNSSEVQIQQRFDTAKFGILSTLREWGTNWRALATTGHMIDLSYSKIRLPQTLGLQRCMGLPRNGHIRIINLKDNMLDDDTIAPLMAALKTCHSVTALDLSRNRLTARTAEILAEMVGGESPNNIRELVIGYNNLGDRGVVSLCSAVRTDEAIWRLGLQGVGAGDQSAASLGSMLSNNDTLKVVDFSRNRMGEKGAALLAEGMCSNQCLQEVNLSHNGLGDAGGSHVANYLDNTGSLAYLDMSNNNLSAGCCMVLANRLIENKHMDTLVLNENPLTLSGASRLLGVLMDPACGLRTINMVNCSFIQLDGQTENIIGFDEANPNRRYILDLGQPIKREVAIELIHRWGRGEGLWKSERYDNKPFSINKAMDWPVRLPTRGVLELDYVSVGRLPESATAIDDEQFYPLWTAEVSQQSDNWKLSYIRMLASQVYFKSHQAQRMFNSFVWKDERGEAFMELFGRLVDPENLDVVLKKLDDLEKQELLDRLGMLQMFNPANLTSRYVLNMSRQLDYTIACRLLAEYSGEIAQKQCNPMQLQFCWRNVALGDKQIMPWEVDPKSFKMPRAGMLVFDYTSFNVPQRNQRYDRMTTPQLKFVMEAITSPNVTAATISFMNDFRDPGKIAAASGLFQLRRQRTSNVGPARRQRSSRADLQDVAGAQVSSVMDGDGTGVGSPGGKGGRKGGKKGGKAGGKKKEKKKSRKATGESIDELQELTAELKREISGDVGTPTSAAEELEQFINSGVAPPVGGAGAGGGAARPSTPAARGEGPAQSLMVQSANEEKALKILRAVAVESYVMVDQVAKLMDCFQEDLPPPPAVTAAQRRKASGKGGPSKETMEAEARGRQQYKPKSRMAEVVIAFFGRIIDREKIGDLLRRLPTPQQVVACNRLGWLNVFNGYSPDLHYRLRLNRRDEEEVAKRLVKMARRIPKFSNIRNLRINETGTRQFKEDAMLWTIMTGNAREGETPQTVVEFDFVSSAKQREVAAAVLVQTAWRRKRARSEYLDVCKKVLKIQVRWFGHHLKALQEVSGSQTSQPNAATSGLGTVMVAGKVAYAARAKRLKYLNKRMEELEKQVTQEKAREEARRPRRSSGGVNELGVRMKRLSELNEIQTSGFDFI